MVHKVERMADIFVLLRKYKLEPKRMRLVYSNANEPATLVLIEGVKGGKPFLKMESPIYVYEDDKEYTEQIKEIYGMDKKGITALINSSTAFEHYKFPNGTVLDVVLHPSAVLGDDG